MTPSVDHVQYSVVAFYGIAGEENTLSEFFSKAVAWFKDFDRPPRYMGTDLAKGLRPFETARKKAARDGFSLENTRHVSIRSEPYNPSVPAGACDLECGISTKRAGYCYFSSVIDLLSSGDPRLLHICKDLIQLLAPAYGIGFNRPHRRGPVFFALGFGCGRDKTPEEDRLVINFRETTWQKLYLKGHLGGVFPWNFLTAPQLNAKVGRITLQDWIRAKSQRGALQPLSDNMVLWSVPDDHIPAVYKTLWDAEVVFDYDRYCDSLIPEEDRDAPPPDLSETMGELLRKMGYQSAEEPQVFKVEGGKPKELPAEEVQKMFERPAKRPRRKE